MHACDGIFCIPLVDSIIVEYGVRRSVKGQPHLFPTLTLTLTVTTHYIGLSPFFFVHWHLQKAIEGVVLAAVAAAAAAAAAVVVVVVVVEYIVVVKSYQSVLPPPPPPPVPPPSSSSFFLLLLPPLTFQPLIRQGS